MIINSFRLNTDYFLELFEDVPSYKLSSQLYDINNHPIWLIGHMIYSFDQTHKIIGGNRITNDEWDAKFGTGSRPMPITKNYPNTNQLVPLYHQTRDNLIDAVRKLSLADMARPNNLPKYKAYLPTYGDLLTHLMIGHTQYHCGQLSLYRMAHGLVRIPEKFDDSKVDKENGTFFECPICDKRFTQRPTFSEHLKSHQEDDI